ncbi:hypothetical protein LCGC14_2654980 [marine sediment metagenome]|uniref:Uncharacterized protein n=1 Tax=marine sediment metagenome TaxID=412755 RepID=A0A0F9CKP6_9ZZZZ
MTGRNRELPIVRDIGFDNTFRIETGSEEEVIFFIGPQGERGTHATEETIREFIDHCEHRIRVAKEYLANGRTNETHKWAPRSTK